MVETTKEPKASSDKIVVDTSNLTELKATCDEAVERILSRQPDPHATSTQPPAFAPFKVSHFHTDLRLVLGFAASAVMIGTSIWAYFVEKEWKNNKHACAIAVVVYTILSGIQMADSYLQGNNVFIGTRKAQSDRTPTEHLTIASPPLPKAIKKDTKTTDGKPILTPPAYSLDITYRRTSTKDSSHAVQKSTPLPLGHLGEWFTQEGEFIERVFEQRLLSGLEKVFGQ
ncbi:hypothetical protein PHSY_001861 [Pseudozyma hubeiensis SY62]|uniref:Signal peptidase complex subunit 2 n=1 Tax=Pseudozyma hubeiensis (strain SY62) TaxID=1305764 RepID=R9P890_PSEHS|nr:hypothetical protein PHSY_001861 [Pseudozyma hubeiensis SY62]GAC94290.1 hypothetical protein PHSY_001861 [Pseudozyma hubeiensis SY62]